MTSPQPGSPPGDPTAVQPLRRLSHTEYEHTLRDLFPGLQFELPTLPADALVDGFSNNVLAQVPSDLLTEQYFKAALSIAQTLTTSQVAALSSCSSGLDCAEGFIRDFGRRAFRRPLSEQEVETFLATFTDGPGSSDWNLGARLVIMGMLQSASFLYRPEIGLEAQTDGGTRMTPYEVATRLSYFIWASTPDEALLEAAARGELESLEGIRAQATRLLDDPRAKAGVVTFLSEWLKLPKVIKVSKRAEDEWWDESLRAEVLESAVRFTYDQVFATGGTVMDLLTSNQYPATPGVAELLGVEASSQGWGVATTDSNERGGYLMHPAFLAAHGYGDYPSPVLRGVYIMDRILCAPPTPPPPGVVFSLPDAEGEGSAGGDGPRTNREAYTQVTGTSDLCVGCHSTINPIGFAFENFDTFGRYRVEDNGFPVDASGAALGFTFENSIDFVRQLTESNVYRSCVVKKVLNYGFGGGPVAVDPGFTSDVLATYSADGYSLAGLFVAAATHDRFSRWLVLPTSD